MVTVPDLPEYPQYLSFTQAFTYDGANRLATASEGSNWSRAFGYDEYGNMWIEGSSGINPLGNAPQSQSSFNANSQITTGGASFDAAGNQLVVNGDTLAYDAENRMISAYDPVMHSTETYIYDGNGQRVQKSGPGGTTTYVYDAFGNLAAEFGAAPTASCTTCYLSYDHLGSVRLVTDQNGDVVSRHDYLPFGEEIPATAGRNGQWGSTTDSEQKFTGQIRDTETGMDYFNARYFTNALGRFNSPDPENAGADPTDPQTWNAYAYVRNNPLALVDPTGMTCVYDDKGNIIGDNGDGPSCGSGGSVTATAPEPPDVPVIWIIWPSGGGPDQQAQPTEMTPPAIRESLLSFRLSAQSPKIRTCPPVPTHPTNASLAANASEAKKLRWLLPPLKEYVFYLEVRNGSQWDYKQQGRTLSDFGTIGPSPYQDFGNFNFGVVGAAAGLPRQELLRGAGYAQEAAKTSSPEFGHWYSLHAPYGDDPADQAMIQAGITYYQNGCAR